MKWKERDVYSKFMDGEESELKTSYLTIAPYRESIVNSKEAGLLTCNIFTILPVLIDQTVDFCIGKNLSYLQLRDSS
jgi:hypothetical protein